MAAAGGDPTKYTCTFGSIATSPAGPPVMDLTSYDTGEFTGTAVQEFTSARTPLTIFNDGNPSINASLDFLRVETITSLESIAYGTMHLDSPATGDPTVSNELAGLSGGTLNLVLRNFHFDGVGVDPRLYVADGSSVFGAVTVPERRRGRCCWSVERLRGEVAGRPMAELPAELSPSPILGATTANACGIGKQGISRTCLCRILRSDLCGWCQSRRCQRFALLAGP